MIRRLRRVGGWPLKRDERRCTGGGGRCEGKNDRRQKKSKRSASSHSVSILGSINVDTKKKLTKLINATGAGMPSILTATKP